LKKYTFKGQVQNPFAKIAGAISSFLRAVWAIRMGRVFLLAGAGLAAAAVVVGVLLYNEGNIAAANANHILQGYKQAVAAVETAAPSGSASASATEPSAMATTFDGFHILGTLTLNKLNETLPIISQTDDTALKSSICYYMGALPGEKGNMVITGHNYASGSMFGKLDQLKMGDTVQLQTPDKAYTYKVYNIETITPDNVSALDKYKGDYSMTLMTCTSQGNERLLVQCDLEGNPA
jgi:LPXTG-site transpeptidase (sortase) family protein